MDLTPSVARLDHLCNLFAGTARAAAARGWPDQLTRAAECLALRLEELAGAIDTSGDQASARASLGVARSALPQAFEAFGRALAESLTAGSRANRRLPRRLARKD